MFAEPFDEKDGYRIWLDPDETDQLLAAADSREERTAFALGEIKDHRDYQHLCL